MVINSVRVQMRAMSVSRLGLRRRGAAVTVVLVSLCARPSTAQRASDTCSYASCALGIAPAWSGLDVESGADGRRVARLSFFWPTSLNATFAGNDSAAYYGARATQVRRRASAFTDAGAVLLAYSVLRQAWGEGIRRRPDRRRNRSRQLYSGHPSSILGRRSAQQSGVVAQRALCALARLISGKKMAPHLEAPSRFANVTMPPRR